MNNELPERDRKDEGEDTSNLYLTDNSTLQTPEETAADKNRKPDTTEEKIETNTIEEVDLDRIAGSDRAGTNERKP